MRRGDVWTVLRLGHERRVVIVENDDLTEERDGVLTVPLSDVHAPSLISPRVSDADGQPLGTIIAPFVGQVSKGYLALRVAALDKPSQEAVDIALRAVLAL